MQADTQISLPVHTRLSGPEDASFLRALFASNCLHLHALGLPPAALGALIEQQYTCQQADYHRRFPFAHSLIALAGQVSVGQMVVNDDGATLHIVDLAVVPAVRGRGYGRAMVRQVQARACEARRQAVTLSVDPMNQQALRLYGALGFEITERLPIHWRMLWRPLSCAWHEDACADSASVLTTTKG